MNEICYNERNNQWDVSAAGGKRSYHDMALAIGFGDPVDQRYKNHTILIGGTSPSGRIDVFEGHTGPWNEVLRETINLKDRYLCKVLISAAKPETLVWELEEYEGLTRYHSSVGQLTNRKYYTYPPETWPYFRSYDHKVMIDLALPNVENDIESACIQMEDRIQAGRIRVPKRDWNILWRELKKPLEESIRSSVLKAAIWLTTYLHEEYEIRRKREERENGPRIISHTYGDII